MDEAKVEIEKEKKEIEKSEKSKNEIEKAKLKEKEEEFKSIFPQERNKYKSFEIIKNEPILISQIIKKKSDIKNVFLTGIISEMKDLKFHQKKKLIFINKQKNEMTHTIDLNDYIEIINKKETKIDEIEKKKIILKKEDILKKLNLKKNDLILRKYIRKWRKNDYYN